MKQLSIALCLQALVLSLIAQNDDFPRLHGPYLGQKLPCEKQMIFAPGIISTPEHNEFCASFSSDGKEFYFNRGMIIMVSHLEKDGWTIPEPASFNGNYRNHEAHVTFDNKRLFFGGSRPPQPYGIWMTERTDPGWSEPQRLADGMYVTSAENGNIYYGIESSSGASIVQTRFVDGRFSEPVIQNINFADPDISQTYLFHPAIAPDDSYIVFDNNEGLFVCFRQSDGLWSDAVSLNELLDETNAVIPSISPDARFLFFASQNDLYWISTDIIQKLKNKIQ